MVGDHVGIRVAVGSSFCRRVGRFSQQRPENHSPRLRVGSCALLFFHCLHCLGALGGTCFAPRESVLGIGRAWEQFPRPCLGTQLGLGNRDPPHAHSAVWETNWGTKPLVEGDRPTTLQSLCPGIRRFGMICAGSGSGSNRDLAGAPRWCPRCGRPARGARGAQRGRVGGAPKPAAFASDAPGRIPRSRCARGPQGAPKIGGDLKARAFPAAACAARRRARGRRLRSRCAPGAIAS